MIKLLINCEDNFIKTLLDETMYENLQVYTENIYIYCKSCDNYIQCTEFFKNKCNICQDIDELDSILEIKDKMEKLKLSRRELFNSYKYTLESAPYLPKSLISTYKKKWARSKKKESP